MAASSGSKSFAIVGIYHPYRDERRFELLDKIFIDSRTIAYLHTLHSCHLKQARLHIRSIGKILVYLYTILVAGLQVNKHIHLSVIYIMNDVLICKACHSTVFRIFYIIIIGVVVLHFVLHVVLLLFCFALGCISGTNTGDLLRNGNH